MQLPIALCASRMALSAPVTCLRPAAVQRLAAPSSPASSEALHPRLERALSEALEEQELVG